LLLLWVVVVGVWRSFVPPPVGRRGRNGERALAGDMPRPRCAALGALLAVTARLAAAAMLPMVAAEAAQGAGAPAGDDAQYLREFLGRWGPFGTNVTPSAAHAVYPVPDFNASQPPLEVVAVAIFKWEHRSESAGRGDGHGRGDGRGRGAMNGCRLRGVLGPGGAALLHPDLTGARRSTCAHAAVLFI
jgi:hypothetical protein